MLPTIPTTTGYPAERTHYTPAELGEMTLREIVAVRTQAPEVFLRTVEALNDAVAQQQRTVTASPA
jgi:hypothetical protein